MDDSKLTEEIHELNLSIRTLIRQQYFYRAFFRGMVQGLGTVTGATVVVAIVLYIFRNIEFIPIIGNWFSQIIQYVVKTTGIANY